MQKPYWHLSGFYFVYFASLGALIPFWSVYLNYLQFDSLEIGLLMSTLALSKIVAPYLWGWIADRSGFHIRIVQLTSLLSLLCFLPLLWLDGFWTMLACMLLFSFFWNASLPQFEVVTLGHLGEDTHKYSQIRLWGSLGFIVTVSLLGLSLQFVSIDQLPLILAMIFLLIWLSSLPVPEYRAQHRTDSRIWTVLRKPQVVALLLTCFFMLASHGPYYTFYSLFMESLDYSRPSIGLFWSLSVLAEVLLFVFMHRLLTIRSASFWLILSMALACLRWLLMAWYADVLMLVLLAQCLHAATYGMFHAAAIHLIHHYFPHHHGRGQALYASVSFGAGGMIGSLYAGSLWQTVTPEVTYLVAAMIAFIGLLISLKLRSVA